MTCKGQTLAMCVPLSSRSLRTGCNPGQQGPPQLKLEKTNDVCDTHTYTKPSARNFIRCPISSYNSNLQDLPRSKARKLRIKLHKLRGLRRDRIHRGSSDSKSHAFYSPHLSLKNLRLGFRHIPQLPYFLPASAEKQVLDLLTL